MRLLLVCSMIDHKNYSTPEPLANIVKELSNPGLSQEQHRDDVNRLVMNFVMKFIAEFLDAPGMAIDELRLHAESIVGSEKDKRGRGIEAVKRMIQHQLERKSGLEYQDDSFPIECILDVQATAAIVKEIIFNDRFEKRQDFVGLDLGSGSGILSLAAYITSQRARIQRVLIMGMDRQQKALNKSQEMFRKVAPRATFQTIPADIRRPDIMTLFEGLPLSSWISETISTGTVQIRIQDNDVCVPRSEAAQFAIMLDSLHDPYVEVLANTVRGRRHFIDDVKKGRTAMFPDLANGLYAPNPKDPRITLRTGTAKTAIPLQNIGQEFSEFEDFGSHHKRFPFL